MNKSTVVLRDENLAARIRAAMLLAGRAAVTLRLQRNS